MWVRTCSSGRALELCIVIEVIERRYYRPVHIRLPLRCWGLESSSCTTWTLRQGDLVALSSEAGLHYNPMTRFKSQEGPRRTLQFDTGAAAKCLPQPEAWDKAETKAMLEFVLFYWTSDAWPTFTQSSRFCWEAVDFCRELVTDR